MIALGMFSRLHAIGLCLHVRACCQQAVRAKKETKQSSLSRLSTAHTKAMSAKGAAAAGTTQDSDKAEVWHRSYCCS